MRLSSRLAPLLIAVLLLPLLPSVGTAAAAGPVRIRVSYPRHAIADRAFVITGRATSYRGVTAALDQQVRNKWQRVALRKLTSSKYGFSRVIRRPNLGNRRYRVRLVRSGKLIGISATFTIHGHALPSLIPPAALKPRPLALQYGALAQAQSGPGVLIPPRSTRVAHGLGCIPAIGITPSMTQASPLQVGTAGVAYWRAWSYVLYSDGLYHPTTEPFMGEMYNQFVSDGRGSVPYGWAQFGWVNQATNANVQELHRFLTPGGYSYAVLNTIYNHNGQEIDRYMLGPCIV